MVLRTGPVVNPSLASSLELGSAGQSDIPLCPKIISCFLVIRLGIQTSVALPGGVVQDKDTALMYQVCTSLQKSVDLVAPV